MHLRGLLLIKSTTASSWVSVALVKSVSLGKKKRISPLTFSLLLGSEGISEVDRRIQLLFKFLETKELGTVIQSKCDGKNKFCFAKRGDKGGIGSSFWFYRWQ